MKITYDSQVKPDIQVDLNRHVYLLKATIGIGEFDLWNYGKALKLINESIDELKRLKTLQILPWPLNYQAQVYTAIGQFEKAENTLLEAIALLNGEEPSAIRGNNLALLGKLYLEWGDVSKAEEPLMRGWKETQEAWMIPVVPIVRIYYAELLMNANYINRDLSMAVSLLQDNIKEVEDIKFYHNRIFAYSLLGKISLIRGDLDTAVNNSTLAVKYLQKMGAIPLVRIEEVFFNHYSVLKATSDYQDEADIYLKQAYRILHRS